jgi:hypothetical protein
LGIGWLSHVLKENKMLDSVGGYATYAGVSKILSVTYWQVWDFVKRNRIQTVKLVGSQAVLVKLADVAGLKKK